MRFDQRLGTPGRRDPMERVFGAVMLLAVCGIAVAVVFHLASPRSPPRPAAVATAPATPANPPLSGPPLAGADPGEAAPIVTADGPPPAEEAPVTISLPDADDGERVALTPSMRAAAIPGGSATLVAPTRAVVYYSAVRPGQDELAERVAEHLRKSGVEVAAVRAVDFRIGAASVRYYYEDDRDGATMVAASLRRYLGGAPGSGRSVTVRDFTGFAPKPRPGTIQAWIPTF